MASKETLEGNKLIAEFMGWKRASNGVDWVHPDYTDHGTQTEMMEGLFANYRSWDWLMPVVEKINKMFGTKSQELSNHSADQKHLENPLKNPLHWKSWSSHWIHLSTDINYVWQKVVEAITWYNSLKQ